MAINDTASLVQHCEGCHTLKQARGSNHFNLPNLASLAMGNGFSWTTTNCSWKPPIHRGRSRVLHQMDRSKATSNSQTVKKFFWQQIICRFGVPRELTLDNGTQFNSELFKEFCLQVGTRVPQEQT
jgi:hypothetical protein